MAREYLVLDPAGYKRTDEPGMHWYCSGDVLFRKYFSNPTDTALPPFSFFNPRGTEWLLPQVRQFKPHWNTDPDTDLDQFVLTAEHWVFAPELSTPENWVPENKPGSSGAPANKWVSTTVPATFTDIGSINWTKFKTAAGVKLPAGFGQVAACPETPNGRDLKEAEYTPFMQWLSMPGKDDLFAFGWGDMALLAYRHMAYVLRRKGTDDWELLGSGPMVDAPGVYSSGGVLSSFTAYPRSVAVLPVGLNGLLFYFGGAGGDPLRIKIRDIKLDTPGPDFGIGDGGSVVLYPSDKATSWWVACAPEQQLNFQAQVMGYELTGMAPLSYSGPPHFDTGAQYKPTLAPKFGGQVVFRSTRGNVATRTIDPDGQKNWALLGDIQTASLQIRDETYAPWVSDGTHHAGYVDVVLNSGSPGIPGQNWYYLAPQVRVIELQFPVKQVPRECTPLTLDGTQFMGAEVSASLQEAGGKRALFRLFGSGAAAFQTSGLQKRSEFPAHWMKDTDGDGVPDTILAAAWISNPHLTLKKIKVGGQQVAVYELEGQGLLHPMDILPVKLPQLVNPDGGGFIEHTYCVRESLRGAGIDVDDGARLFISFDPYAGTGVSRMPGYWGQTAGTNAVKADSIWAMDWNETFLQYCDRIAKTWSAWNFYEGMGVQVRYHPDLLVDLLGIYGGATYHSAATIYATKEAAIAAGVPGQHYLAEPTFQMVDPEANVVRVTGKDTEGYLLPTLYEEDAASLTTPSYENHLGYRKPFPAETKLAVSEPAMRQICHIMLQLLRQRMFLYTVNVPLSYDSFGVPGTSMGGFPTVTPATIDVGYVVTLENLGPARIIHLKDTGVTSRAAGGYHVTTLTCQMLPAGAIDSNNTGRWPGVGA